MKQYIITSSHGAYCQVMAVFYGNGRIPCVSKIKGHKEARKIGPSDECEKYLAEAKSRAKNICAYNHLSMHAIVQISE